MFNIFFEKRFVYEYKKNPESFRDDEEMTENAAGGMIDSSIKDSSAARDIMTRLSSLREDMHKSSLLNDEDQKVWQKKIDEVKEKPTHSEVIKLEQEFKQQQDKIQKTVGQYSEILLANKKTALAVDKEKGVDTYKEYMDWLMTQNDSEKEKALAALGGEIQEKINLRKEILRLNPQLKGEVLKMDRTTMKEKLKELELSDKYIKKARALLERDKKYSSDFEAQLKHYADLTPEVQAQRLEGYEKFYLQPRKEVFDKFESIPSEIKTEIKKDPDLPPELQKDFHTLRLKEKKDYLENLEDYIEEKFIKFVNEPQKFLNDVTEKTWSHATKRFAIQSFMELKTIKEKAERLHKLPDFIKAEQKLTEKYNNFSKDVKAMPDYSLRKWEKMSFEEKQEMLKKMEAEEIIKRSFTQLLANQKQKNVISDKTYERMMEDYNETSMEERLRYIRNFAALMQPRDELLKNFMSLGKETQNHYKQEFINRGYRARLEIFKEAKEYEAKNEQKSDKKQETERKEDMPKPLNSPDLKAIINNLHTQADLYEDAGKIEKALGIHESVMNIDPNNRQSLDKIKDLKVQAEAMEAVNDKSVQIHIDAGMNEEIGNIALLEDLLKDRENQIAKAGGVQNASRQHTHLGDDTFKHDLHRNITEKSGGKKILGKDGRVKDVYTLDMDRFGRDSAQDRVYDIKKRREELAENENFVESRMVDGKTGKVLSFDEARKKLEIRKQIAAKNIAGKQRMDISDAEDFIDERINKAA